MNKSTKRGSANNFLTHTKERKGITLIALVVTIIVLLILAGVTIATLTGENGILTRAETAKKETHISEEKEIVKLATIGAKDYKTGIIDESELRTELTNYTGGVDKYQLTKNEDTYEVTFEDCGRKYTINAKGKVTLVGENEEGSGEGTVEASIEVSNLIVKNGETVLEENSKSVATGTPLTISFDASIEGGTITSVEPSLPYTPADSVSVKLSEIFTITGTDKSGKTVIKEYTVILEGYYYTPELKVGDYITGYTLRDATNSEVAEEITNLNTEVNSLSGYKSTQNLSQASNVQWRVLEIDETTGQPTKLISANGVGSLGLRGAMGYNNAVYLLNKACETLYSGEQGTARSITIEDLEEHYSATGKQAKANYKAGKIKFGDQKRYTSSSYRYYPQIAKEEKGIGIDTEIYTAEDGNTYNTLNNSGIEGSNKGSAPYEGTETKGSAYNQASSNGITVTQTYYSLSAASPLNACYENEAYYSLFHGVNGYYWLASRCVNADSIDSILRLLWALR